MQFPDIIHNLPEAIIPVEGLRGWLTQSPSGVVVFFVAEETCVVPAHSHKGQWGTVVDGEATLTADGVTQVYGPGESYFIPAGVVHSANLPKGTKLVEFFEESERFRVIGD
ncbi:MAG: cupin domain-containing protein [Caldilineaceae bacterium]|nr:cupin domain-containing protein [Caldilineaceae bacterium]MBP8106385.1 cupin domain-containing protein [Caldilineaceae bacterium]MBP8121432.1 cupin domain-containing protein [Caldilineaceae bacterium]MBP9072734.1 cupin domain-containing protein [Caldilineaceae bacterium]